MKTQIKKILVLGSGALKIGEAGEFDYSGTQAIKALKEEGIHTVLVNPNIATIQTSKEFADTVYFLPVNAYFVEQVIAKEKPDGIFLSFGGQTALNCGIALHQKGILKKHRVQILGSPIDAIILSEDRKKFAHHLQSIHIPTPVSKTATTAKQALTIAKRIGYPVMVRSGFALGGEGSGIATSPHELQDIARHAFSFVNQILVEKYLRHYKEVEYEVVRDNDDNCITVCNMENMDPLGIHTGESIVIAPSQTLTNFEYHTLRSIAIKIVRSLRIVGECNVQFALNPNPKNRSQLEYYVIELNARLSRSSALASKATGYPLAYVAAKLALGKNLMQLQNKVTKVTQSCFEPSLDYVTVKIPRWDIGKFKYAETTIGSSMKSVGEVMGIGRTFEEAYQKAIRMLDLDFEGAVHDSLVQTGKNPEKEIEKHLTIPTPTRLFFLAEAMKHSFTVDKIHQLTGIDRWFLYRIQTIVLEEKKLLVNKKNTLEKNALLRLKQLGFSDKRIGILTGKNGLAIRKLRKKLDILPSVFQIDTLAGEFAAKTNYLYFTYNGFHHDVTPLGKPGVIVLGSGPYRIGSSVEFDWSCVNTVYGLKKHKKQTIVVNCNPETVSTDYDISDRLYFEEPTFERIADIYEFEQPSGIVVSMGGQTPNNRAKALQANGFHILGTDPKNIDRAEDRNKFSHLLDTLGIQQPEWNKFTKESDAKAFAQNVGYPVLLRPSFVLSGSNMRVCFNAQELKEYIADPATSISRDHPLTVSKFIINAKEIEIDCVAQKGEIQQMIISEHIENAGVHSGDATVALPAQKVYIETFRKLRKVARDIAKALVITGPFNVQCLATDNVVAVIEANLRASRTFPFISKVTGKNMITLATDAFFSKAHMSSGLNLHEYEYVAVKAAQFSFARLTGADPLLDVEMTSTGEVACFGDDIEEAALKALLSVGGSIPSLGIFISLGGDEHKIRFLESAKRLQTLHIPLFATRKTAQYLRKNNIAAKTIYKIHEKKKPNIIDYFQKRKIDLAINITDNYMQSDKKDDYRIRRLAVDNNIQLFTNTQKAALFIKAITEKKLSDLKIKAWNEYVS